MTDSMLKLRVQNEMKEAMRSRDALRLTTIRMLLAAIKQREIDDRVVSGNTPLTEGQIITIIDKMIKQRQESVLQYQQGNRQDLADKESAEIVILKEYLPVALTADEVTALVKQALTETAATSIKDMAKVMGFVKDKAQGRADIGEVSLLVKELLKNPAVTIQR